VDTVPGERGELAGELVVDDPEREAWSADLEIEQWPERVPHRSILHDARTLVVMGFSRAELESYRDATVPDLIGPGVRLLFVGINPGLWTAATQTHFAHPGNRFYPALLLGGVIERAIDRGTGMTDADRRHLIDRGIGITNVVHRATAKASELTAAELRAGGRALRRFVAEHRPAVVAVAGVTAYRTAFGEPRAAVGRQPEPFECAELWIVPNPSGLNAHETIETLAAAYRAPALAAGVI
jgi:TDG/mug DNA glycosylase family protein